MKNVKICSIFITAFLFRLIALNQSLWLDETITANVAFEIPLKSIISKFSVFDFHPPLYYFFLKIWTLIFGISEISLRMPSVILSIACGYAVYRIALLISSSKKAIFAASLFLFNPLIIYYSQEARMYMLATFFVAAATYFFLKIIGETKLKSTDTDKIFFNIFCALSIFTFYGSLFMIGAFFIVLLSKRKFNLVIPLFIGSAISALLLAPLLIQQFAHSKSLLQLAPNWKLLLGTASFKNLILIPLKFATGRVVIYPKIIFFAIAGMWTLFMWVGVIVGGLKNKTLLALSIIPLILGFAFSFFTPLLSYFRFLYILPVLCILLALGVNVKFFKRVLFGGFVTFSLIYLLGTPFHREDWKSLVAQLPSGRPIYAISTSRDPIRYYRPDIETLDLRTIGQNIPTASEVYIIPYTADIYGFDFENALQGTSYRKIKAVPYTGLTVEVWSKSTISPH